MMIVLYILIGVAVGGVAIYLLMDKRMDAGVGEQTASRPCGVAG